MGAEVTVIPMGEVIAIISIVCLIAVVVAVFLINDKVKTLQYRLEQQIGQNEKIIKLLSEKEK